MIVTILDSERRTRVEEAKKKLGKSVHVGYPFLQEAKVTSVSDEMFDYYLDGAGNIETRPHGDFEIRKFQKSTEKMEQFYSKRLGTVIGSVDSIVHVDMLKGLQKTDDGAMVKVFGEIPGTETDYATQLIVDEVVSADQRFIERAALPITEEFPEGSQAFYLGEVAFGKPLQVTGYSGKDQVRALVGATQYAKHQYELANETWAKKIVMNAERLTRYLPSYTVAKQLNLNGLVLSKLTSAFMINSRGLKVNVGLNLKFEAKKLKVLGYSRKGESGWEYSPKAVQLITSYMSAFPRFIAGLKANPQGDQYCDTDFFAEDEAPARIKEMADWLKSVQSKSFEKVTLDAEQLDSDVVMAIEAEVDRQQQNPPPMDAKTIANVPRHALLKPDDAEQRLGSQKFTVGDRVLYADNSGKVPLALEGTVVGLTRTARTTLLDILFDSTFMSGTTLSDRCSPFRGQTVQSSSVLNLTSRELIVWTARAKQQQAQPRQGYYAHGKSAVAQGQAYGMPGGPQLQPAAAPQQLHGSYSGAANGHAGKHTPSGGPNGYTQQPQNMAYRPNSVASNPFPHQPRGGAQQGHRGAHVVGGNARANTRGFAPGAPRAGGANGGQGGRGGGGNRAGYNVVDNSDPMDGVRNNNPDFRRQNYSAVPPPAGLNARGGDGGRGRGHRRGQNGGGQRGRGRGRGEAQVAAS